MQYGATYIGRNFKLIRPHHASATFTIPAGAIGMATAIEEKSTSILMEFTAPNKAKAWIEESNLKLDDSVAPAAPAASPAPAETPAVTEEGTSRPLSFYLSRLTAVKSSNIKGVGVFDGTLVVVFTNGTGYQYRMKSGQGFSQETFKELLEAESVGKYYNANVKNNPAIESSKLEA